MNMSVVAMRRLFLTACCTAIGSTSMAGALPEVLSAPVYAAAPAPLVTAANPQTLVDALADLGYRAKLSTDAVGDPMITSESSGREFLILFYGCTNHRECTTVEFAVTYDNREPTLETVNKWNSVNRFGRAYITDKGTLRLESDLDLDDGGMSRLLFQDNVEFWVAVMGSLEKTFPSGGHSS